METVYWMIATKVARQRVLPYNQQKRLTISPYRNLGSRPLKMNFEEVEQAAPAAVQQSCHVSNDSTSSQHGGSWTGTAVVTNVYSTSKLFSEPYKHKQLMH